MRMKRARLPEPDTIRRHVLVSDCRLFNLVVHRLCPKMSKDLRRHICLEYLGFKSGVCSKCAHRVCYVNEDDHHCWIDWTMLKQPENHLVDITPYEAPPNIVTARGPPLEDYNALPEFIGSSGNWVVRMYKKKLYVVKRAH